MRRQTDKEDDVPAPIDPDPSAKEFREIGLGRYRRWQSVPDWSGRVDPNVAEVEGAAASRRRR